MKAKIKIVALLLITTMTLSMTAAGCSGASADTTAAPPTESAVTVSATEAAASVPAQSDAAAPASTEASIYPFEEHYEFSCWTAFQTPLTSAITGFGDWPVFKKIEENTNVHINWVEAPQTTAKEKFSLMIASGDFPDMGRGVSGMYPGGAAAGFEEGIFLELTDLIADYMPNYNAALDSSENMRKKIVDEDGRYLYVNTIQSKTYTMNGNVIRKDWLDKLGLSVPETLDEVEEVLLAFKSEYNFTNSVLITSENYSSMFSTAYNLAGFSGRGTALYQKNGVVDSSLTQDAFRQYVEKMKDWYDKGLFDGDFITRTGNPKDKTTVEKIANGETGVFNTSVSIWPTLLDSSADEGMELAALPVTMQNEGDLSHFYDTAGIGGTLSLFTSCSDPQTCCKWLDYFYNSKTSDMLAYGIEGESFEYDADGKPEWKYDYLETEGTKLGVSAATYAEHMYGIKGNFIGLSQSDALFGFYDNSMIRAIETYGDATKQSDNYTLDVTLTADESSAVTTLETDIASYVSETVMKFITGELGISSGWDTYLSTLKDMNLSSVIATYQSAYDRMYKS